jgi:hypothetical protein
MKSGSMLSATRTAVTWPSAWRWKRPTKSHRANGDGQAREASKSSSTSVAYERSARGRPRKILPWTDLAKHRKKNLPLTDKRYFNDSE